jgi:hypothetical protein
MFDVMERREKETRQESRVMLCCAMADVEPVPCVTPAPPRTTSTKLYKDTDRACVRARLLYSIIIIQVVCISLSWQTMLPAR